MEALAAALTGEGFSVAHEHVSGALKLRAHALLAESGCVLVCWSKNAVKSDGLLADAAQAFNQGKLAPVFLSHAEPPFPYDRIEGVDLSSWRGDHDDPALKGLVHAVRATIADEGVGHIARQPAPPPPPPRPPAPTPNIFQAPAAPVRVVPPPPAPLPERPSPAHEPVFAYEADEETEKPERSSRIAPFIIAGLAIVAVALIGGPRIIDAVNGPDTVAEAPDSVEPENAPPSTIAPAPALTPAEVEPTAPVAPPEPATPTPAIVAPAAQTKVTKPAAPTVIPKPAATKPVDPATTMAALEKCLVNLAKQCTPIDPAIAVAFKADGLVSAGERRLLSSPLFPDRALVTAENLNACLAAKTPAAYGRACPSIIAKTDPPVVNISPAIPDPIITPPEPLTPQPEPSVSAPQP